MGWWGVKILAASSPLMSVNEFGGGRGLFDGALGWRGSKSQRPTILEFASLDNVAIIC